MAENRGETEFKLVRVKEQRELETFIHNINELGDIFVDADEEFKHYYQLSGSSFHNIFHGSTLVGVMCVITGGLITVISIIIKPENLDAFRDWNFDAKDHSRNTVVVFSSPYDTLVYKVGLRYPKYDVCEYTLDISDIVVPSESLFNGYDIETLENCGEDHFQKLMPVDKDLVLLDRCEFVRAYCRRSKVICIFRHADNKEILGYGMLSKPKNDEILLGPVYSKHKINGSDILDCVLRYAKNNFPTGRIVAYGLEVCSDILSSRKFTTTPSKLWDKRLLQLRYLKPCVTVVALGSLIFDM